MLAVSKAASRASSLKGAGEWKGSASHIDDCCEKKECSKENLVDISAVQNSSEDDDSSAESSDKNETPTYETACKSVGTVVTRGQGPGVASSSAAATRPKKSAEKKMGGLSLPDVVKELLKEPEVLRWDPSETLYEVLHGERFESRFNELRRVRNKPRTAGMERPFSRMHNFFSLEVGDKWARAGTKFRPINPKGFPTPELLRQVAVIQARLDQRFDHSISKHPKLFPHSSVGASAAPYRVTAPLVTSPPLMSPRASSSMYSLHRAAAGLHRGIPPPRHPHHAYSYHPNSVPSKLPPHMGDLHLTPPHGGRFAAGGRVSPLAAAAEYCLEAGLDTPAAARAHVHGPGLLGKRRAAGGGEEEGDEIIPSHLIDEVARRLLTPRHDPLFYSRCTSPGGGSRHGPPPHPPPEDVYGDEWDSDEYAGARCYPGGGPPRAGYGAHGRAAADVYGGERYARYMHDCAAAVDSAFSAAAAARRRGVFDHWDAHAAAHNLGRFDYGEDTFAHGQGVKSSACRKGVKAGDGEGEGDAIEIDSEGGSCQPSPEGVLSLCGDFDGSPLDLGDPALDSSEHTHTHVSHCAAGGLAEESCAAAAGLSVSVDGLLDLLTTPPASPCRPAAVSALPGTGLSPLHREWRAAAAPCCGHVGSHVGVVGDDEDGLEGGLVTGHEDGGMWRGFAPLHDDWWNAA